MSRQRFWGPLWRTGKGNLFRNGAVASAKDEIELSECLDTARPQKRWKADFWSALVLRSADTAASQNSTGLMTGMCGATGCPVLETLCPGRTSPQRSGEAS